MCAVHNTADTSVFQIKDKERSLMEERGGGGAVTPLPGGQQKKTYKLYVYATTFSSEDIIIRLVCM